MIATALLVCSGSIGCFLGPSEPATPPAPTLAAVDRSRPPAVVYGCDASRYYHPPARPPAPEMSIDDVIAFRFVGWTVLCGELERADETAFAIPSDRQVLIRALNEEVAPNLEDSSRLRLAIAGLTKVRGGIDDPHRTSAALRARFLPLIDNYLGGLRSQI
jgi:hypothetical protein